GDDGSDTTKQVQHNLNILKYGNKELEEKYKFTKSELEHLKYSEEDNEEYIKNLKKMRDNLRDSKIKATLEFRAFETRYMIPVNVVRIINNYTNIKDQKPIQNVYYILNRLDDLLEYKNTKVLAINPNIKNGLKIQDDMLVKTVFKLVIHEQLAP